MNQPAAILHPVAQQHRAALVDLLLRLADDELIIGHRNSEWTGLGPALEEDIAFASMAQDELGHAQAYYQLLHELGEAEPDHIAFTRTPAQFRSCQLVEQPIGDYAFSLVRQFLYDTAEDIRLRALKNSSYPPLAELAGKLLREEKYHLLHAHTWLKQLAKGGEEARLRLQSAIHETAPLALGLFEVTDADAELAQAGIQAHEGELEIQWRQRCDEFITAVGLQWPAHLDGTPYLGGRRGYHSEHLAPLLAEMTEVFAIDPSASW